MIRNIIKRLGKGGTFVLAVAVASVVGGATTAFVMAAIPGSDGVISACYTTKSGALKVIDAEGGKTCTAKQTALNWDQNGGQPLYDNNGQFLGDLIDYGVGGGSTFGYKVYNPTLNRIIEFNPGQDGGTNSAVGNDGFEIYFQSTDCTGQPYILANNYLDKTELIRWDDLVTSNPIYAVVADNTTASTITASSILGNNDTPDNGSICAPTSQTGSFFATTLATLPFSSSIAPPFKF